MLNSDTLELDKLLSKDLVFTNHLGMLMTKQDDLEAHRTGRLKITEINLSDQIIVINDNTVVVSVKTRILGSFEGEDSVGFFRFTRVWKEKNSGFWQVIAGHSSVII